MTSITTPSRTEGRRCSSPAYTALSAILLVLVPALAQRAGCQQLTLELDPQQTEITFTLGATAHTVNGTLYLRSGVVTFDPAGDTAQGELVVDARRTDTENDRRDRKMHEKVLLSERFPQIRYVIDGVEGDIAANGESEFTLLGVVHLAGTENQLRMPVRASIAGEVVTADAGFEVPYVRFGLHDPSVLVLRVAKHVDVTVRTKGTLSSTE